MWERHLPTFILQADLKWPNPTLLPQSILFSPWLPMQYWSMKRHFGRSKADLWQWTLNESKRHNISSWSVERYFNLVIPMLIHDCTSTILLSSWIMGACGLIYRIFFSLWYLLVIFIEDAESILSLLGVSFIMSATMTTGLSISLIDIFTYLI